MTTAKFSLISFGLAFATPLLRAGVDYQTQVAPILRSYCAGCHNGTEMEGDLSVETHRALREGGADHGDPVKVGDAEGSFLIKSILGQEKPKMPPKDEPQPTAADVAVLRQWIAEGAVGPKDDVSILHTMQVAPVPTQAGFQPVAAFACSVDGKRKAVARAREVEIDGRKLPPFPGKINAVHFSPDGTQVLVAGGTIGLRGLVRVYHAATGELVRELAEHRDALYDAEWSPDGKLLATAGYDRLVLIWNAADGKLLRTLDAHKGAIFDLAWHPQSQLLASASADETVKLWRVADGMRLDTLNQPQGELNQVLFAAGGEQVVAVGRDKRIHQWQLISKDKEALNPALAARFAHEAPIVAMAMRPDGKMLVTTAEDRSMKWWTYPALELVGVSAAQPDQVTSLAFGEEPDAVLAARMDGSLTSVKMEAVAATLAAKAPVAIPEVPASSGELGKADEMEPNDAVASAQATTGPVVLSGKIATPGDVDVFKFSAKAGQPLTLQIEAEMLKQKSQLDSKLEILHLDGKPVPQVVLQATRDSWFTFRGKDSMQADDFRLQNWMEMELNEYLYANGEVVKLWLYPRGPDSGFITYPGEGNRQNFFFTTGVTHALNEPAYIVQPLPPGTTPAPNGLPVFPIFYANDDEVTRANGKDSELQFLPPADGDYLVRVSDVRGFGEAKNFHYQLAIRPRKEDFKVTIKGKDPKIGRGSGQEILFKVDRFEGFAGPVTIELSAAPSGFTLTPSVEVDAGQITAVASLQASAEAVDPDEAADKAVRVMAKAVVEGKEVVKELGTLGNIQLGDVPKVRVEIQAQELKIRPGETISAKVKVQRLDFKGPLELGKDGAGRNLPHGAFVDNIGLNGLLLPEGMEEREFFITASKVLAPGTRRQFHLKATNADNVVSNSVWLNVVSANHPKE
jgi:hypothetical protein